MRIHRGRSGHQKPPAALTSVLLARHGCPPGLAPALAGLGSRDIVGRLSDITSTPVVTGDEQNCRLDLPQITVTAAAPAVETDCDLCRHGQQDRFYQQQQQQQLQLQQLQQIHQQSSSGLRENVSNASQAYKVLYMETPLCSCGRMSANGRTPKIGNNKRSALEIFQTAGNHSKKNNKSKYGGHRCLAPRNGGLASLGGDDGSDPSGSTNSSAKPLKMNRRSNIKAQVKRFKMETKAAKTLGNKHICIIGVYKCTMKHNLTIDLYFFKALSWVVSSCVGCHSSRCTW